VSGNGADIGHVAAMLEGLVTGQEEIKRELRELRSDHGRKLDDHGRQLQDLRAQVSGLRQSVTEYHATVLGHGVLISELDARLRRVERHLNLPPVA
jgi:hypothetical protein